ncbi:MAG: cytochrome P450 [Anaerolineae bacterium]|nr:cytochrome P450 [Anaerolineae bacterium]
MTHPQTPPGPPAITTIFQVLKLLHTMKDNPLHQLMALWHQHGRTFQFEVMGDRQLWTSDPALVRDILITHADHFEKDSGYTDEKRGLARFMGRGLLTSNGDFWKRQRKLVAPALHARRIAAYAGTMIDYTRQQMATWHDGAHLDISREMNTLTMRIVARTLFNTDVRAEVEMVHRAMQGIQDWAVNVQLSPLPTWLPTPMELRARRAAADLDAFVYGIITEWRKTRQDRGDLLSMLLLAEDDDGRGMSDKQARDEIVTLFLAGHETTANTLNWTWMLLAQHPQVEARLHAELDSVLQGRPPTLADLKQLPYTEMVIKESMRLYPPAYSFSRVARQDITAGGWSIPQGLVVNVFTYAMHRDPALWEAADEFRPERWSQPETEQHRYQYVPFGGGARVCIGNLFAMMEAQLILASIAQQYRLALKPGQVVELHPVITLNPRGGLPMTVHQREAVPAPQPEPAL